MPGPMPVPTAVKKLKGVRPARINQNEPHPLPASANIPAGWGVGMSEGAKKFWKRNAQRLVDQGLLTEIDLNTFRVLCETWSDWVRARKELKKSGMTYVTKNSDGKIMMRKMCPEVKLLIDIAKQLKSYLELFGMAPAPRGKISAEAPLNLDNGYLD